LHERTVVDVLLLLLTFTLGALLSRVSLCAVAGMQQAIATRSYDGLERLLLASSGAGLSLLLLAGLLPEHVWLPTDVNFHAGILAGGALLGLGAMINGGCYLGSVLYLGTGNLNFLFTLAGIGLGLRGAEVFAPLPVAAVPGLQMAMGHAWLAGLGVFALIIIAWLGRRQVKGQWLALAAGLLAGLVYARQPGWSYGSALEELVHGRANLVHWRVYLSAASLFAGALGAARFAGRFRLQAPTLHGGLRRFGGGLIMGFGAALVPGGNDNLLLWAIPGLTFYGALAYALMLFVMALGFALAARWPRHPPLAG
jgi:toxin CptA